MVDAVKLLRKLRLPSKSRDDLKVTAEPTAPLPIPAITKQECLVTRAISFASTGSHSKLTSISLLEDPSGKFAAGTGATTWDSSIALVEYLLEREVICDETSVEHHRSLCSGAKILELGAGLGLPSMVLAKLGFDVTASERSMMLTLLKMNLEHNNLFSSMKNERTDIATSAAANPSAMTKQPESVLMCGGDNDSENCSRSVSIMTLDWMDCNLEELKREQYDVIVGADLIFPANKECWSRLADIFQALLRPIVSMKRRSREEGDNSHLIALKDYSSSSSCIPPPPPNAWNSPSISEESSSSVLNRSSSCTSTCISDSIQQQHSTIRKIAFLAFERREGADMVFHTFFEVKLHLERGITFERVFIDSTPSDIHIYKLFYP